jgi:short-subunit dehydrogenase
LLSQPPIQRALITGATSGIGRATAERFIRNHIEVGILAENPAQVEQTVEALRSEGGRAFGVHADLSQPEAVEGLIPKIEAEHGPLDLLVNNAGLGLQGDVTETHQGDVRLLFEINFFSMVTLSRDAFRVMAERGRGHIINISSASAKRALPGLGIYASTKAAMHAFSQALRIEGKGVGVEVTEILPMSVRTPFFQNACNRSEKSYSAGGWSITPEELAERILKAAYRPVPEIYTSALARIAFAFDALSPHWLDAILIRRREASPVPQSERI